MCVLQIWTCLPKPFKIKLGVELAFQGQCFCKKNNIGKSNQRWFVLGTSFWRFRKTASAQVSKTWVEKLMDFLGQARISRLFAKHFLVGQWGKI